VTVIKSLLFSVQERDVWPQRPELNKKTLLPTSRPHYLLVLSQIMILYFSNLVDSVDSRMFRIKTTIPDYTKTLFLFNICN
jgi:hypothetical protein